MIAHFSFCRVSGAASTAVNYRNLKEVSRERPCKSTCATCFLHTGRFYFIGIQDALLLRLIMKEALMNFVDRPQNRISEQVQSTPGSHDDLEFRDPAEFLEFSKPPSENFLRFDRRSNIELFEVARSHDSDIERERAIWELGDRLRTDGVSAIADLLRLEADSSIRRAGLWLLQKLSGHTAAAAIESFMRDDDAEVRSWATLLLDEAGSLDISRPEPRPGKFDEDNPFDQTLPLLISGYAQTHVRGLGWVQVTLSPKWFELIMGRVMACTQAKTFESDLVIEKCMKEFHGNRSDHYEVYKFRGVTFHPQPRVAHHVYSGISEHAFYPSGKVGDHSQGKIDDVVVGAARAAQTVAVASPLERAETERQRMVFGRAVQSVRGRYYGTAFVNVERLMQNGMKIGEGEVQLTDVHHPVVGPLTNTFLCGSFKGKLSDLDGDGCVDVNTQRCHGTVDGKLDFALLGHPNPDPFE
jgi:hypothetical protein